MTFAIVDGVITLGWPAIRVYVDFFPRDDKYPDGREILQFPMSDKIVAGKHIDEETLFALLCSENLVVEDPHDFLQKADGQKLFPLLA